MDEMKGFEGFAIVEIMGHVKVAGRCSEQPIAGTNFLRVDVPEHDGQKGYTRFFGGGSIYSITPTDEATVMIALKNIDVRPEETWVVPNKIERVQLTGPNDPRVYEDSSYEDLHREQGFPEF
jgi:hypothetical protein